MAPNTCQHYRILFPLDQKFENPTKSPMTRQCVHSNAKVAHFVQTRQGKKDHNKCFHLKQCCGSSGAYRVGWFAYRPGATTASGAPVSLTIGNPSDSMSGQKRVSRLTIHAPQVQQRANTNG